MAFAIPSLPYAYDALEPAIDARTMELHHTKHHQAYVDKLNAALANHPDLANRPIEDLLLHIDALHLEGAEAAAVRNHGGGHANHSFFWTIMGPEKTIDTNLVHDIEKRWESVEAFKKAFSEKAATHFGSGWMWLVRNQEGQLDMYTTPNQDSPVMQGHTPLIGLDVWEHAYYLKYQNRRTEYIQNWWSVLKLLP